MKLVICDGGKKTDHAYGSFRVFDEEGEIIVENWHVFGEVSSNESEYLIFIEALHWCVANGYLDVMVFSDSALVVNQTLGDWKCEKEHLKAYVETIHELISKFNNFKIYKATGKFIKIVLGH